MADILDGLEILIEYIAWRKQKAARRPKVSHALHELDEAVRIAVETILPHIKETTPPNINVSKDFIGTFESLEIHISTHFIRKTVKFIDILIELERDINSTVLPGPEVHAETAERRRVLTIQLATAAKEICTSIESYLA